MRVTILSSKEYDEEKNYGDCIIIDTGDKLIIYDCGSEEHARYVINYMDEKGYEKASFVLSHNDSDHFAGLQFLIEHGRISSITTLLLLKHIDDILDAINDGRKNRESIKKQIADYFDNIYSLSGNNLNDAMDETLCLDPCINVAGPSYEYILNAVAKALDNNESDTIDKETIINAISVQIEVIISNHKLLLTGDASFEAIKDIVREYDAIQLPHHGKNDQGQAIFDENSGRPDVIYIISDNTGNSNGGSDDLMKNRLGKIVKNTKDGEIIIDSNSFIKKEKGSYNL